MNARSFFLGCWLGCLLAMLLPVLSIAQTVTGTIHGRVLDSSGGVIPGVRLQAINTLTNAATVTASEADGAYLFPALPVGQYRIEVEHAGFKKFVRYGTEGTYRP